ncbi:MAG: CDP-alcohol phosphatidyltransferase family protein, partial [Nitrospinaceae bacterium]
MLRFGAPGISKHERLLGGSGLNHDSPVTRLLSRPVSRRLTRWFLGTKIHPNQITLFSFALGLAAAAALFQGTYGMNVLGGLLLVCSTWVDGSDGEIARLKFLETDIGGKLDILCDNVVHFLVFAAIGWGVAAA